MLKFIDSFDHYNTAHLDEKWTDSGGFWPTITAGAGRCSSQAAKISVFNQFTKGIQFGSTSGVVGFAIKPDTGLGVSNPLNNLVIGNGFNDHVMLTRGTDGAIYVINMTDSATFIVAGSDVDVIRDNIYYYVEFKFTIHGSAGVVEVRVNNTTVLSETGVNTSGGGSLTPTRISFYGNDNQDYYIDDLYVLDDQGGVNNDFLGDVRVENRRPTADGFYTDWGLVGAASEYLAVDDNATPDDDTSYITTSNVGDISTQVFQNTTLPSGSIYGVQVNLLARKTDSGPRNMAPVIRLNSADYVGTPQDPSATSYRYLHEVFDENPDTSSAWDITAVNDMEVGVKLTA